MEEVIEQLNNVRIQYGTHYTNSVIHKRMNLIRAMNALKANKELEAIYYLTETHAPAFRYRAVLRYEKHLINPEHSQPPLSKNHITINCSDTNIESNMQHMLDKIEEMPEEWTLVQLTPHFNPKEVYLIDSKRRYTNSLYISVFNCGKNQLKPFCISIDAPIDVINNSPIELAQELYSILTENKQVLDAHGSRRFKSVKEKQNYYHNRVKTSDRLKALVKDLQNLYLAEWRCLFVGKYEDSNMESTINEKLERFFRSEEPDISLDEKTKYILCCLVKTSNNLKLTELKRAIQSVFTENNQLKDLKRTCKFITNLYTELSLEKQKKHPLILVLDDSLDYFPWEMMDILAYEPVSRLPSIHLAYGLFKEHQETIKGGYKIIKNPLNGAFIVNPDSNLSNMESRIISFFKYWVPEWKGIAGCRPTEDQFQEMLTSNDVFLYAGHGSGIHLFSNEKIQKIRTSAVVILFGCSSTGLEFLGPQVEMCGTHQMYFIACSPCIMGMLWPITDFEMDTLSTEFISNWIPNENVVHWSQVNKLKWREGIAVEFPKEDVTGYYRKPHEPNLLRALSTTKKCSRASFYETICACVARGIPVKYV